VAGSGAQSGANPAASDYTNGDISTASLLDLFAYSGDGGVTDHVQGKSQAK